MAEVKLYKKLATYTNKDGEEKQATNFFIACGDELVPIDIKYFEDKETGIDKNYRVRKTLLSAFAELLPERENNGKNKTATSKPAASGAESPAPAANSNLPF